MVKIFKVCKCQYLILLIFLLSNIYSLHGQYNGGIGDGYDSGSSVPLNLNEITIITVPEPPVAIAASDIGGNNFIAIWNLSILASKYFLDIDDNSDFSSPLDNFNNLDVGNRLSYRVNGLVGNTTYYYRVRAYNDFGTSSNSNIISITTRQSELTITGIIARNKPYDGNRYASLDGTPILNGVIGTDDVALLSSGVTALFDDSSVGMSKLVTITGFSIIGSDSSNYNLIQPTGFTADITRATPIIIWTKPLPIENGTALSSNQLNATSYVPGTFVYTPEVGTILNVGNNQELKVNFTPLDYINCTTTTKSVNIDVTKATGIEEFHENSIFVYPNPTIDKIFISGLSSIIEHRGEVKIIDLNGKVFLSKMIYFFSNEICIDISSIDPGAYYLFLQSGSNQIVKQIRKE